MKVTHGEVTISDISENIHSIRIEGGKFSIMTTTANGTMVDSARVPVNQIDALIEALHTVRPCHGDHRPL